MEVGAQFQLSRAYTAPQNGVYGKMHSAGPPSLIHSQTHTSSSYSMQSQPSSRSSDTTQGTAQSTLFPQPTSAPFPSTGPPIEASNNVMNRVADKDQSLFQICVILRQRLKGVPDYDIFLEEEEQTADDDTDPVTLLWRMFRRGYPLLALYNVLRPERSIRPDLSSMTSEIKRGKALTFKFLRACIDDLKFSMEDCFLILDLYGDDTTGFVKVTRMVTRLLDILVEQGIIEDTRRDSAAIYGNGAAVKRSQRQHIVSELVTTERTYVQQLELLQAFKQQCEQTGVISGDIIHQIFLNLNALLDFQRRFLIRVEQINSTPEEEQNWGKLFVLYNDAFNIYEPYITNQKMCEATVMREFDKLKLAGGSPELQGIVATPPTLYSFLMKPFQRLSKYPLLLDQLIKKGDFDELRKADLESGKQYATAVLERTNAAMDREAKLEAVQELKSRVEDWKGHRVEGFGDLLLYGTFTVVKSDAGPSKDAEREYHVYFFESILLCCKDIDPTKAKNRMKNKPLVDKRGKPKLQLKGRIFMQNVTDVLQASKGSTYTCQIFWKGDPGIENFTIRFAQPDVMNRWYKQLLEQKKQWTELARQSDPLKAGVSSTEFTYIQNQGHLENPYRQEDEEEEDDMNTVVSPNSYGSYPSSSDLASSRNGSSASLRSRSTTGDSGPPPGAPGAPSGRMLPPKFAPGSMPQPALSIRTQQLQNAAAQSPAERYPESYFSPTAESPMMSSRTSSSSGMSFFPQQQVPPGAYYDAGPGRHTAPSMPYRSTSREAMNVPQGYPQSARIPPPRPNLAQLGMHSVQQPAGSRNRSVSSPNINDVQRRIMKSDRPPLPEGPLPPHALQYPPPNANIISRSQSNSPHLMNSQEQQRPGTQSPKLGRDRSQTRTPRDPPPFGYDGTPSARVDSRFAPLSSTSRSTTPMPYGARDQTMSPPPPSIAPMTPPDPPQPTQLKVKVHATSAGQVLTLVVPLNITYQSLKDRIDAKLQRSTNISLGDRGGNQVKLKYLDEEDYVSIQSDEDVQIAFETWREQRGEGFGGMGEIELFCQ